MVAQVIWVQFGRDQPMGVLLPDLELMPHTCRVVRAILVILEYGEQLRIRILEILRRLHW